MRPARLALALAAAACSADFTPRSVLTNLTVLAAFADPLEVGCQLPGGPGDAVSQLGAATFAPPGVTISAERWTFCPFSLGSSVGYACLAPDCVTQIDDPAVGFDPCALAEACLARLLGSGAPPPGLPAELPPKLDSVVRYQVTSSDGESREVVQLLPLYPGDAPADRNVPPIVTGVAIGGEALPLDPAGRCSTAGADVAGALAPGKDLEVAVALDPASVQTYADDAGNTVPETLVVSFYTTAGRFDFDRANGPDARVALKYEDIDPAALQTQNWTAQVYAVARDLRGGEACQGPFRVTVSR